MFINNYLNVKCISPLLSVLTLKITLIHKTSHICNVHVYTPTYACQEGANFKGIPRKFRKMSNLNKYYGNSIFYFNFTTQDYFCTPTPSHLLIGYTTWVSCTIMNTFNQYNYYLYMPLRVLQD